MGFKQKMAEELAGLKEVLQASGRVADSEFEDKVDAMRVSVGVIEERLSALERAPAGEHTHEAVTVAVNKIAEAQAVLNQRVADAEGVIANLVDTLEAAAKGDAEVALEAVDTPPAETEHVPEDPAEVKQQAVATETTVVSATPTTTTAEVAPAS